MIPRACWAWRCRGGSGVLLAGLREVVDWWAGLLGVGSLAELEPENPGRRARLVAKTAEEWKVALVDFGGRNNLLHFRDLKVGTLDLTTADMDAVSDLLLGKAVRV